MNRLLLLSKAVFIVPALQSRLRGVTLCSRFVYGAVWSAIGAYIDDADEQPRPFIWTTTVKPITAKIEKSNAMCETVH